LAAGGVSGCDFLTVPVFLQKTTETLQSFLHKQIKLQEPKYPCKLKEITGKSPLNIGFQFFTQFTFS
jgi:hypothetical protein